LIVTAEREATMLWWTLRQLKSNDEMTRLRALRKLGNVKDPRAVEPLIALLKHEDREIRRAAASALELIGAPNAEASLAAYRSREEEELRVKARHMAEARTKLFLEVKSFLKTLKGQAATATVYERGRELRNSIRIFGSKHPDNGSVLFLFYFFTSLVRALHYEVFRCSPELIANTRLPENDIAGAAIRSDALYVWSALQVIRKYPDCVRVAYETLGKSSQSTSLTYTRHWPGYELNSICELMSIYDLFWDKVAPARYESPLDLNGAVAVRAFLKEESRARAFFDFDGVLDSCFRD
jgi:hypothetical protein